MSNAEYSEVLSARECRTVYRACDLLKRVLVERPTTLSRPGAVRDYLRLGMALEKREIFVCLWLDAQNRLIESETMFVGTLTQTSVYPREVVKAALYHNAGAVILAHNHPSGTTSPSGADIHLTRELKQTLGMVDVKVLDHFIVGGVGEPLSMQESYYAPFGTRLAGEEWPTPKKAKPVKGGTKSPANNAKLSEGLLPCR